MFGLVIPPPPITDDPGPLPAWAAAVILAICLVATVAIIAVLVWAVRDSFRH